ncbi:MAG: hypothetical protein SF172_00870 [Burkholderiales bacterium]|nr:hypothetical protein [Burkholderiales bacterium]
MNHEIRNWRQRWTVDEAGQSARHECGLVVMFDGERLVTDAMSRAKAFERLEADEARGKQAGARLALLIRQGERLLRGG